MRMSETMERNERTNEQTSEHICKVFGWRHTRNVAVLDDNGEKLISANIVLLQFAFAIYFICSIERNVPLYVWVALNSLCWHYKRRATIVYTNVERMNYIYLYIFSSVENGFDTSKNSAICWSVCLMHTHTRTLSHIEFCSYLERIRFHNYRICSSHKNANPQTMYKRNDICHMQSIRIANNAMTSQSMCVWMWSQSHTYKKKNATWNICFVSGKITFNTRNN